MDAAIGGVCRQRIWKRPDSTEIIDDLRAAASIAALAMWPCRPDIWRTAKTVENKVGTYEAITPGVFHKLYGALASQGLQILSAEINTLADGLMLRSLLGPRSRFRE